jgi:hypothetical protein
MNHDMSGFPLPENDMTHHSRRIHRYQPDPGQGVRLDSPDRVDLTVGTGVLELPTLLV